MGRGFKGFVFGLAILMMSESNVLACTDYRCDDFGTTLSSATGGVALASVWGILNAVGNFIGGFRWNKHAGVDDETTAEIQEAGWLMCSAVSLISGLVFPIWLYYHAKNHPAQGAGQDAVAA